MIVNSAMSQWSLTEHDTNLQTQWWVYDTQDMKKRWQQHSSNYADCEARSNNSFILTKKDISASNYKHQKSRYFLISSCLYFSVLMFACLKKKRNRFKQSSGIILWGSTLDGAIDIVFIFAYF